MSETEQVVQLKRNGKTETRVGIPVCTGPASYRLLVTWPERNEGRIIEIAKDEIESISQADSRPRGRPPRIATD
ncbi:MAG: hypothetical protein WDZ96_05950 [Acidimicrobiia bacterium]